MSEGVALVGRSMTDIARARACSASEEDALDGGAMGIALSVNQALAARVPDSVPVCLEKNESSPSLLAAAADLEGHVPTIHQRESSF